METEITDIGKVAITPRKDYKNEQTYEWLDVVTYDGAGYMCIAEDGCTGIVPTNTDYWQLLADKGHFTEEDKEEFKKAVVEESKTEINEHTDNKKTELNNYTTELEKSLENELDTYKTEKEGQLDLYKATLETEMTNKKDSLIEEIETAQDGFDANVEEKTNTFNSNVETKTTEFNNNSNAKTEEFNNNFTEKINNFNSNAEEKIADYNEHVETLTSRITDLEEETNDLFNALDTEKASGTELYIEDAKPCRIMNTEIGGMYKQETTTGAQLFNYTVDTLKQLNTIGTWAENKYVLNGITFTINTDLTIGISGTATQNATLFLMGNTNNQVKIPGKYICVGYTTNNVCRLHVINYSNGTHSLLANNSSAETATAINLDTYQEGYIGIFIPADNTISNATIKPILSNTATTSYEQFTGGIASPSPDYPQAIEQVDSVKLQYTGSNLLDYTKILSTPSTTSGITIKLEENGNITISGKPKYSYFSVIQSKNIIDILKDGETYYLDQSNYNRYFYTEIQAVKADGSITYIGPQKSCVSFKVNKSLFKKYVIRIIGGSLTNWGEEERTVTSNFKLTRQKNLPFEKYIEKTVNIDLKGNKLCAISDTIKDKLLVDRNGNVALQKNVDTYTITGDEEKIEFLFSNGISQINFYVNCKKITDQNDDFSALSNFFKKEKKWSGSWLKDNICVQRINAAAIRLQTSKVTTLDEAKELFKQKFEENNPVIIYFQIESKLIDLGQIPELPKTFEGVNNIWAETNLGNTEIEVEYVQDVKKLLEQQNARLDNIEALLSTTETSALLLDNMQTDLESEVE